MATSTLLKFAWLEVTGLCNEFCDHCYADSGPQGSHGTMSVEDWVNVIDQLAEMGTLDVQSEDEWLSVARYVRHAANKLLAEDLPLCLPGEPQ